MIEELKPCPEMIEKVARAIYDAVREETGGQWPLDTRDKDELSGLIDEYIDFRPLARAAITTYDPDKRLREALEECDPEDGNGRSPFEEIAALRNALERIDRNFDLLLRGKPVRDVAETKAEVAAALSHNGG